MQPVITSLLDTDLYKFTMWQAMLHRHPQTQAEYTFVCRNTPAYPLAELLTEIDRELDALCALSFRQSELAYLGSLRFIRSDFVDFLRIFRFQRDFITARAARRRQGPGDRRQRPAGARDGVRDLRPGDRQRALLSPLRPARRLGRGQEAPRRQDRPAARVREGAQAPQSVRVLRLRRAPALLGRMAPRGAHHPQARGAAVLQGRLRRALCPRPRPGADRHDGARVPADLPDARRSPARLPARRARGLGPGIPRRPRHGAHRRRRHGRLPRRLRPLFRQAVRRPAPRLGRPLRLGREGARPLREAAHRSQDQAAGLLRRARLREVASPSIATSPTAPWSASASAPTSPTTWG